jgi:hypothetical protein
MDSFLPAFIIGSTANALFAAAMSSRIRSSPRRPKLADIKDGNGNNSPAETQQLSSSSSLWNSPSRKNLSSPPKRNTAKSIHTALFAATPSDSQPARAREKASKDTPSPALLLQANSPGLIRLDPRISNRCKSSPATSRTSGDSQTSYTEEPKSIFYPHGHKNNAGSASSSESNAFTLTPTVMFSDEVNDQQTQKVLRQQNQQYHQSPHWTGKVRINPFSPVPPKYLEPPDSTRSLPSLRSGLPTLTGSNLSPMNPSTQFPQLGQRRSRRLKPKHETFPSMVMEDRVSPTDVTEDPFGMDSQSEQLCLGKSPFKRKAGEMMHGLPQPKTSTNKWESPTMQVKVTRSRYLEDFEEVSHLGSGSFGSVNACLSRLDGCMYAIKSVSPHGIQKSNWRGYNVVKVPDSGVYGGRQTSGFSMSPVPPTPRRDVVPSPMKKRKHMRSSSLDEQKEIGGGGLVSGTSHWTETALRRMLREVRCILCAVACVWSRRSLTSMCCDPQVHALAALCSQADARTFHIVRYQQAWFEEDGTLYIQTELCSNTLRDEMKANTKESKITSTVKSNNFIHVPQRFKCLREILLALQLVHSKGMVHLDIKPDNIFVHNGLYKLGDFGLAGIATSTDVEEGDSRYMSRDMLEYGQRDLTKVSNHCHRNIFPL